MTINFKGVAPGNANLSISGGSVLANDGQGTEVFSGSSGANFTISAPKPADPAAPTPTPETPVVAPGGINVASSSHANSEVWYTTKDISLSWDRPSNIYGYSFILDQNPTTEPDSVLETTVTTNKSYSDVKDGIWYFHIKGRPRANSASFGPTTHYKIQIDSTPPKDFELKVADSTVTFQATDEISGVDHYQALVDGRLVSENATSPYTFTDLSNGLRSLQIIAFDKANNKTESLISVNINKEVPSSFWDEAVTIPWYLLLLMNLLILILLVVIVWLLLVQKKYSRNNKNNTIQELQSDIDLTLEKLRNEISSRLLKLNANSIDELVQKESKIAKSINSDIKKSKVLIDKKITKASKKR